MSDNVQRYHAVRNPLRTMHPAASTSKRLARHLGTLGGMVAGIVAAGQVHLPKLALKAPDATKAQSRTKRFARFLRNEATEFATFYEPFARMVAADCSAADYSASDCSAPACLTDGRSHETPLLIVFDSSAVGRGCAVLMASVVYQQRALPLAWIVRKGKKGHFPSSDQRALLRRVRQIIPEDASAIFLGDGEFDSVALQRALDEIGFDYVCRTALSTLVEDDQGEVFPIGELSPFAGERYVVVPGASVTNQSYGPVQAMARCRWSVGMSRLMRIPYRWLLRLNAQKRRSVSTSGAFRSRPYSPIKRAEASTSTKAILRLRSGSPGF